MVRRPLTTTQVDALKKHGTHLVSPSLYLQVKPNGARSWLFRYKVDGKDHWHGLGAAADVDLKEAREQAENLRVDRRRHGRDPVAERRAVRAAVAPRAVPTFEWCAEQFIASHEAGWKNAKHRAQWESTLKTHAGPIIGKLAVDRIGVDEVYRVLNPIWREMPETASRLRGRIEAVLGWAAAKGYRDGDNPARWKGGALEHLLPAIGRVRKVKPRESVPYTECPALMTQLATMDSTSSRALRFTILTAVRTSEALGARWSEFDLQANVWTIPPERMKAGVEHVVPLSAGAIALLGDPAKTGFVFPGARPRKPLSNMAMLMVLRGIRDDGSTVHGFRSSFRTWAAEVGHPREVAEMCLAHATGSAVDLDKESSGSAGKEHYQVPQPPELPSIDDPAWRRMAPDLLTRCLEYGDEVMEARREINFYQDVSGPDSKDCLNLCILLAARALRLAKDLRAKGKWPERKEEFDYEKHLAPRLKVIEAERKLNRAEVA